MARPDRRRPRSREVITRREALKAGIALFGGGLAARSILPGGRPGGAEPLEPADLLRLPDRDLLCVADEVLDRPAAGKEPGRTRRVLLRILAAAIEIPSLENDVLAARTLERLRATGPLPRSVVTLVRGGKDIPVATAALERILREGGTGEEER